jgi:hypothetical protein
LFAHLIRPPLPHPTHLPYPTYQPYPTHRAHPTYGTEVVTFN